MICRSICHSEGLDLGDEDELRKLLDLRAEIEPLATLMRAVRVITSPLGDEHVRLNGLAKIMKEKIDWEENAARKIADAD